MRSSILWTPQHLPTYTFTRFHKLSIPLFNKPATSSLSQTSAKSPCASTRSKWRIKRSIMYTTHSSRYASVRLMLSHPGRAIESRPSKITSSQVSSRRWRRGSKPTCIKLPSQWTSKASTLSHIALHASRRRALAVRCRWARSRPSHSRRRLKIRRGRRRTSCPTSAAQSSRCQKITWSRPSQETPNKLVRDGWEAWVKVN